MNQFPIEFYSEFFLDMLEVYHKCKSLELTSEDESIMTGSLFLFGGFDINRQQQAFIQFPTKEQILWQ